MKQKKNNDNYLTLFVVYNQSFNQTKNLYIHDTNSSRHKVDMVKKNFEIIRLSSIFIIELSFYLADLGKFDRFFFFGLSIKNISFSSPNDYHW